MSRIKQNTGIYCIENRVNGKRYIGQAYNVERRLYEHEYHLTRGTDKCVALQRAVNKHGFENFDFYLLEACQPEDLNEREIIYISMYATNDRRYGYNISKGGKQGLIGYKHPPEVGRKISMVKKGMKQSEEAKRRISESQKGKVLSEETKRKISAGRSGEKHYLWGKQHTEEAKQKMSQSHLGTKAYQFGKKSPNASSQFFGVKKQTQRGNTYYIVALRVNRVQVYIGSSKDELEAARMYDAYVIENNLPNPLNFMEE
jgi:group I intron endonuclease